MDPRFQPLPLPEQADPQPLLAAFPGDLAGDVDTVARVLPRADGEPTGRFIVRVGGESVTIPYRTHHEEPLPASLARLTPTQLTVLHCWYTRNGNGYVRQRHLRAVVGSVEPWVAPFVVQLIGEYILPIQWIILRDLRAEVDGSARRRMYGQFVAANPAFVGLTASRVASYWGAYFRNAQGFRNHIGAQLIDWLRTAERESRDAGMGDLTGDVQDRS